MKETTRTIQVKAYTDDEGKPVCGDCSNRVPKPGLRCTNDCHYPQCFVGILGKGINGGEE